MWNRTQLRSPRISPVLWHEAAHLPRVSLKWLSGAPAAMLATLLVLASPILATEVSSAPSGVSERRETARIDPTLVCDIWNFNESVMCSSPDAPDELVRLIDVLRWFERYLGVSSNAEMRLELWPDGIIPYAFDSDFDPQYSRLIARAMTAWTAETNIRFQRVELSEFFPGGWIDVPIMPDVRTPTPYDAVFVRAKTSKDLGPVAGRAGTGRITVTVQPRIIYKNHRSLLGVFNGQRDSVGIDLNPEKCEFNCVLHELGHTIGLLHEHQRWDRDRFVRMDPSWIAGFFRAAGNERNPLLDIAVSLDPTAMPLGASPYDYTSIMHYDLRHTVPPGIPVRADELSDGDVLGVKRMYEFALPTVTVIETNPPGLEIIVDGRRVGTPYPVLWPRGTEHTLEAPLVQHDAPRFERYLFGNWGGSGRKSSVPTRIHVTADLDKTLWFQANYIVQTRREGNSAGDPYCQPWVYGETTPDCSSWPYGEWIYEEAPAPPSYSQTYESAASFYRDRIAAWPQAFTFVSPVGSSSVDSQSIWLMNATDSEQRYVLRNLGRDLLSLTVRDAKGGQPITHDFRSVTLEPRETAEFEFRIRQPSQYAEGSYDATFGVCQFDASSVEAARGSRQIRTCLDVPLRFIVVPEDRSAAPGLRGDDHGDTNASATRLRPGAPIPGIIDTNRDLDLFQLELTAPAQVTVWTTGSVDTLGILEDSLGDPLAFDDDSGTATNFRIQTTLASGVYYLRVHGFNLGSYTLRAESVPQGAVADDHGDSRDTATNLFELSGERAEISLHGSIESEGDRDYFRFETAGLQYVEISTAGDVSVRGSLWRAEADGRSRLVRGRYRRRGRNFRMETRLPSGSYFVEVAGTRGSSGGEYTLSVRGSYAASVLGPQLAERLYSGREIEVGSVFADCVDCPLMAVIPGGRFRMGRPLAEPKGSILRASYDLPMTEVRIGGSTQAPLAVGVYEVTYGEWLACRKDGGCRSSGHGHGGRHDYPATRLSFDDMQDYAEWLSRKTGEIYRLPTDAEWEYAARAGTHTQYGFGNRINTRWARHHSNAPAPVGTYASNAFGLHDMHGNVREATGDCWNDSLEGIRRNGWSRLSGDCSRRVVRGGSYRHDATILRSGSRAWWRASSRETGTGFRVVREVRIR